MSAGHLHEAKRAAERTTHAESAYLAGRSCARLKAAGQDWRALWKSWANNPTIPKHVRNAFMGSAE